MENMAEIRCSVTVRLFCLLSCLTVSVSGRLMYADHWVEVGHNLELDCTAIHGGTWADIHFCSNCTEGGDYLDQGLVSKVNEQTARLKLPVTTADQGGILSCIERTGSNKKSKKTLMRTSYTGAVSLEGVDPNFKCKTMNSDSITCQWNISSEYGTTRFELWLVYGGKWIKIDCHREFAVETCAYCKQCKTTKFQQFADNEFMLKLKNGVSEYHYKKNISVDQTIQQLSVKQLETTDITSRNATLLLTLPRHPKVHCRVNYTDEWFNETKIETKTDYGHRTFRMDLKGLLPATKYGLHVECRPVNALDVPVGLWSRPVVDSFVTKKDVPFSASNGTQESFMVKPCWEGSEDCRNVVIYWKPLQRWQYGMNWINYNVTGLEGGTSLPVPGEDHVVSLDLDNSQAEIFVTAFNEMGPSKQSTSYRIAAEADMPPQPVSVHAELFNTSDVRITWQHPESGRQRAHYTVYWCQAKGNRCVPSAQGVLQSRRVEAEATHLVLPHSALEAYFVSLATTDGHSSGMVWAKKEVKHSVVESKTFMIVSIVVVVLFVVIMVAVSYRYGKYIKRKVWNNIWLMPRPEVPKPPAMDGLQEKYAEEGRTDGRSNNVRSVNNRYHLGRSADGRRRLPSDLTPLCNRSVSMESGNMSEPDEALLSRRGSKPLTSIREMGRVGDVEDDVFEGGTAENLRVQIGPNKLAGDQASPSGDSGISLQFGNGNGSSPASDANRSRESLPASDAPLMGIPLQALPGGYVMVGTPAPPTTTVPDQGYPSSGVCYDQKLGPTMAGEQELPSYCRVASPPEAPVPGMTAVPTTMGYCSAPPVGYCQLAEGGIPHFATPVLQPKTAYPTRETADSAYPLSGVNNNKQEVPEVSSYPLKQENNYPSGDYPLSSPTEVPSYPEGVPDSLPNGDSNYLLSAAYPLKNGPSAGFSVDSDIMAALLKSRQQLLEREEEEKKEGSEEEDSDSDSSPEVDYNRLPTPDEYCVQKAPNAMACDGGYITEGALPVNWARC